MDNKLKIYSVSDDYIRFLRDDDKLRNVFDNKEGQRTHTRKYLGIVFVKNNHNYFIPFSSPKDSDYMRDNNNKFVLNKDGDRVIRKNTIPIIRMTAINRNSNRVELKGTLKISNMIPIPQNELTLYDYNKERDSNYKIIVEKQYDYIKDNHVLITNSANTLYNQKTKETTLYKDGVKKPNYLNNAVDFNYAEIKCLEYCKANNLELPQQTVADHEKRKADNLFKGKIMGKAETAKKMFAAGYEFDEIQEITGLKSETLEKLQESVAAEKKNEDIEPQLPRRRS